MTFRSAVKAAPLTGPLLVLALAAGWLLPNHYPPWASFHGDAWIAGVLAISAIWVLARGQGAVNVSAPVLFLVCVAGIPWAQHLGGLVPLRSDALMSSLYLAVLAVAFAFGQQWESKSAGTPAQFVLMAAAAASVASVGIQIYQWFGFAVGQGLEDIWIMDSDGSRPYANLGQPNQLGSLLLWGLLGVGWAWHRGWVRGSLAVACAGFILFGVALTESRTALLTLTLGTLLLTLTRPAFVERRAIRAAQALCFFYLICLFGTEPMARAIGLDHSLEIFQRSGISLRGAIWRAAWEATGERPWSGFGWNHTNEALLEVAAGHPVFRNLYAAHSHNLALDLILWVGWPLSLAVFACVAYWMWRIGRTVKSCEQLLVVSALAVLLVHAMLELPLQYGYFLWPFGVLAGSASAHAGFRDMAAISRKHGMGVIVAFMLVLAVLVRDYLNVEAAFAELRFQVFNIGTGHDERPPETVLLNDWAEVIIMARGKPTAGMTDAQIQHWKDLLIYNVSPLGLRKVVGALALNGRTDEARYWNERSCTLLDAKICGKVLQEWVPASGSAVKPEH